MNDLHLTANLLERQLKKLPESCIIAADKLSENKDLFTNKYSVFPDRVIEFVIRQLNEKIVNGTLATIIFQK